MPPKTDVTVPDFRVYMNPILESLRALGGSATVQEMYEHVAASMQLTDEQLAVIHDPEKGNQSEAAYRMAWARTYLKAGGLVENSSRGVWALTPEGTKAGKVDERKLAKEVLDRRRGNSEPNPEKAPTGSKASGDVISIQPGVEEEMGPIWKQDLLATLQAMPPDAFERLCQRVLRENGFVEVKVTGRSGDGGIDGVGILRLHGLLSFHVIFQCKRWKNAVGSREIRDFRGAMVGRTDKGLFISTGTFTRDAQREATRDGAPPIDLVDGDQFADLLKQLGLGVKVKSVEQVVVDRDWLAAT